MRRVLLGAALAAVVAGCSTVDRAKKTYEFVRAHIYQVRAPVYNVPVYRWRQGRKIDSFVNVKEGWLLIPAFGEWMKKEPD